MPLHRKVLVVCLHRFQEGPVQSLYVQIKGVRCAHVCIHRSIYVYAGLRKNMSWSIRVINYFLFSLDGPKTQL